MPVYAYRCTQCGHEFDIRQEFSDAALTECPECGGLLRKKFGSIGVTFSGPGFYRTDSRASVKPGSAPTTGSTDGGGSTSSSSGSSSSGSGGSSSSGSGGSSGSTPSSTP